MKLNAEEAMPRYRASFVGLNGRQGRVVLDAVDLASLTDHIERRGKAFILDVRRVEGGDAPWREPGSRDLFSWLPWTPWS